MPGPPLGLPQWLRARTMLHGVARDNSETVGRLALTSIVLAADEGYLPYVPCTLMQIARFGRAATGVILTVPAGVDNDLLVRIKGVADEHQILLAIAPIEGLDALSAEGVIYGSMHISRFAFAKLLLAEALPELDEVVYLDVDTLILAPLDDLLSWKLSRPLGAVTELDPGGRHLFGTNREPYFNSGVLRLSLESLRRERLWDRAKEVLMTHDRFRLVEQDVLNIIFRGNFDPLPATFNVFHDHVNVELAALQDPTIVHFCGPNKPWSGPSTSVFAREWRAIQNSLNEPRYPGSLAVTEFGQTGGNPGHGSNRRRIRVRSLAQAALPGPVKRAAKTAAMRALHSAEAGIDRGWQWLQPDLPTLTVPVGRDDLDTSDRFPGSSLDLVVSIPGSGAEALGAAIQLYRPADVRWLGGLHLGVNSHPTEELEGRFPWFSQGNPEILRTLSAAQGCRRQREFSAAMSSNAIEVTESVLANSPGRTLIKILPDQLRPRVLERLLTEFRPRLLILRRELIFTYLPPMRAKPASSWGGGTDSIDAPCVLTERSVLEYAVRADAWIDGIAQLSQELGLHSTWVSYSGLFATGSDVPLLESLYPGAALGTDPHGGLHSDLPTIQDRRCDVPTLEVLRSFGNLSTTTRERLLRLPGRHQ